MRVGKHSNEPLKIPENRKKWVYETVKEHTRKEMILMRNI